MAAQNSPVNIFIAYSREDKSYLTEFRKHLSPLKKKGDYQALGRCGNPARNRMG